MFKQLLLSGLLAAGAVSCLQAQPFTGADDLGRVLPSHHEVGAPRSDRHVGMFYFLWQGDKGSPTSERRWDLSEMFEDTPEIFPVFDHPEWGGGYGRYYFWGKPIYGYYRGDDYWVHLKSIQLLTDAQVDFLVIDATNRLTYAHQTTVLMRAIEHVRSQGKNPPKIVFYTNTRSGEGMQEIYETHYKDGAPHRYPDCWFYLDGKPLIIGLSKEAEGRDYTDFFTIRESQWPNEPQKVDGWPWIEFQRPQKVYTNHRGEREIINVSASQHPNLDASMGGSAFYGRSGNWGRSFRNGSPGNPAEDVRYGFNIQEQWDYALSQDVPFVFVTGWNEWIAGKWRPNNGDLNHSYFVDQASPEYSRDIEPSFTAGLRDNYYMQLIANIRRYKGLEPIGKIEAKQEINALADWKQVDVLYKDYIGDVLHRNHPGAQTEPKVVYVNETGRNDFETIKLAMGEEHVYFYAQTANEISPVSGDNWMTLWLNVDETYETGWNGYDFRIIRGEQLQRFVDGYWADLGKVSYQVDGNQLMVTIPFSQIALPAQGGKLSFKWSDNMQKGDPLDWYINGDAAPGGRFNIDVRF